MEAIGCCFLVNVVAESLIDIPKREISAIRGLKKNSEKLSATLENVQELLNEAERRAMYSSVLKELEAVVFDADNVLDELHYHLLSQKINIPKPLTSAKVLKCFSSSNYCGRQRRLALRIMEINEKLETITNERSWFGLVSAPANEPALPCAIPESYPFFVGRDDDVLKLADLLTNTTTEERSFSILVIQGMGGIGKTTLTRELFTHPKIQARFSKSRIWVNVSPTFNPLTIFKNILKAFTSDQVESRLDILQRLQQVLNDKTYLLVLDDVSIEDPRKWEDFIIFLSEVTSTKGNGIIITTRNQKVASIVGPLHIHPLRSLSDDECWSIIKAKAFDHGDVPSELETIGRNIAIRCHGLPLAANVVGAMLRFHTTREEWIYIQDNWLSEYAGREVSEILRLSLHNLSFSLKKCFAYCSISPKGQQIAKQELIELWMAEGFLQPDQRNDMEDVGNKFFNILVDNSLLQVAQRDEYGNVETCVMHDLVYDLASSVLDDSDGMTRVRYMVLEKESSHIPKQVAKLLRTLFLEGEISDIMFSYLESLRNLTLRRVKELPNSIRKLIHLRNLNISKSWITELPEWIGELHHLQTIRALTEHLWKLPSTLKYLINLRHLYILSRVKLPADIGRLTSLQTLRHFAVSDNKGYQIEELGSLNNLKGELHISNLEKVHGKAEAEKANIYQKPNLSELVVEWSADRGGETNDESVLEGLQPHADANLKKLEIKGFKGKSFPLWTEKMAVRDGPQGSWVPLNKLIQIKLSWCLECEQIPSLENLSNLKSLYLEGMKKVRFINSSFNNLMTLYISELEELESLPYRLFENNKNLSKLLISGCPVLRELPDGLDTLNSLEELTVENCGNLRSIGNPSDGGEQSQGILRSLTIKSCAQLMTLPHQMVELWVPSLQTLSLEELSSLDNLPMVIDSLAKSTRLRELKVRGVPEFMATCRDKSWPFGNLQELNIDVSMKWSRHSSDATVDGMLRGCSNSLTRLWLTGVQDWECVPESIQHLTGLTKLELKNLGIEELPEWFGNLSSLSQLSLTSCKKLRCLPSVDTFRRLIRLRRLDIKDCPELRIDPERVDIPHLTIKVYHHVDDHLTSKSIGSCSGEFADGFISSSVTEVLFQNLINAFKEVCTLRRGLDKDAQQLQTNLGTIQDYLNDAKMKSIADTAVEIWLRELEDVAFDADNVLDELNYYHLLHYKVDKMKAPMDKVLSCFSSLNHVVHQPNLAVRIKKINETFDHINKTATDLGLHHLLVSAPAAALRASFETDPFTLDPPASALYASFETDPFTLDPFFIGRDDDVRKLVQELTSVTEAAEIISIHAIVGKGGIGKSTLIRKVLHHEDIEARFGSHIWVLVSKFFDPITLFKRILLTLASQTIDGVETRESILKTLQQVLKGKTYLLVLDDFWNDDLSKWEDFKNCLSRVTSTKGNAIIITTRNEKVALNLRPLYSHSLNGLPDKECWFIIKEKTFGKREVPPTFETFGRKIAERCQGSPLAANVVGGLLLRCKSQDQWCLISESWLSNDERTENIKKILKWSFDQLPSPPLKKCFAYCLIFPEGHRIAKEELIGLWMAEGFLQANEGDDMESVGDKIFNVLLHSSLLQIAERDSYGNVLSCVMLDLVHDLSSFVLGSLEGSNQIRYLIQGSPVTEGTEKYLRTLIFQGEITNNDMFSAFESLHALTLDCDKVKELPSSIRKLIQLRNLNISRTRIEYLPSWISELYYLQTLDASTEYLWKLPSTLKYLINLRHLYLCHDVELPAEIGKLTYLQTLRYFTVGDKKGCQIEELGSLKNLKGKLVIRNLEKVRDKAEALKAELSQKQKLSGLWFEWDEGREGERKDVSVLEGLQPHANLKNLCIRGFKGKNFPPWTLDMKMIGLNMLIEITLDSCNGCGEIPKLGQLPKLKYLSLLRLSKVTSINSSFYGIANVVKGVIFPELESVLLTDMDELKEWEQVEFGNEVEVFPRLRSLKIYLCNKLESLPSWLFSKACNLKELDIRHCSELRELPDGLHTLKSLESMTIKGCPNLVWLEYPNSEQSLNTLRSLEIRDCQRLKTMVESWAMPSLKRVCISELKSLENLPSFLKCLAKSPWLAQLTIVGIPKFISTSGVEIGPFHKLRKLEIDVTTEWSGNTSHATIEETVNGMLLNCCSSLGELKLTGPEIWEFVPESIMHLTALYSLELENIGVGELPEWFGKLKYLTRLCLYNFTKLKCLPSMQSLTALQELHIHNCPELRIDYESHKVYHRCAIYFNGHQI